MEQPTNTKVPVRYQRRISSRQIEFCHKYLELHNATDALIAAGYSEAGAASKACRVLRYPEVKAYLEELQAELRRQTIVTAEEVTKELALIAFSDIGEYLELSNNVTELREVNPVKRRAVASITVSRTTSKNGHREHVYIKMHDKVEALKVLATHLGIKDPPTSRDVVVRSKEEKGD